ncbi:MAG TPA: hypothetical protein VHO67_13365, partial [Polyangia bacterium]|nr:hypothetical protein [Polyangia bacterium]
GAGAAAGAPAGGTTGAAGEGEPGCALPVGPAGTWVEIPAPAGLAGFTATDAFAVGSNDLMFAGSTFVSMGLSAPANAEIVRWTDGCWTTELMIDPTVTEAPHASVHGTGPNDVWAVAADLLYHRDASGWTRFSDETWRNMVRQPPFMEPLQFNRVRAAAPGDVWVAATSNVLHLSGGAWTTYNFDDANYPAMGATIGFSFNDIWIDSPTSVWVVGPSDQVGNTMDFGFVHHFDGTSWTHDGVGVDQVYAIWRAGAVLWLAQSTLAVLNGQTARLSLRAFDGTNAPAVAIAGVPANQGQPFMTSLFGHGANDVWSAGEDVAHYDGEGWSLVPDAPPSARSTDALSNTFVTGDAGSVWLVTPGPRFFRKVTGP